MVAERGIVSDPDDLIYLFLPLAHAFGLLLMLVGVDRGVAIAYWGRDTTKIIAELSEVHPTYLPSVPADLREALHVRHLAGRSGAGRPGDADRAQGP